MGKGGFVIRPSLFFPDTRAKPSTIPVVLPETHPLIETATEPLADNAERRMAAHAVLEEILDADHPGVAAATARLEAAGQRKFPALRKALPWVFAALALAAAIASNASTFLFAKTIYNHDIFEPWEKPALPSGLTEKQRLLLGDPELGDLEGKQRLHLHAPENPAYFAEYVQKHVSEKAALPPDFPETAARIAPDNAFFHYFAAGKIGGESYTKNRYSGPPRKPRIVEGVRLRPLPSETEFTITDPAAFEEALSMVKDASSMSGFETYTNEMIAARTKLLPVGNLTEWSRSLIYTYGTTASGIISLRKVADLLDARAEQLSKDGKKQEFIDLAKQRDAFIAHFGNNPDEYLVGELVYQVLAVATATNFQAAAERLGLMEMEETYRRQSDAFHQERDLNDIRRKKEDEPFPVERASILTRMTLPMVGRQVSSPPPLREADFEPMRMAEHELLGGLGILTVALIIALAALAVFLFRFAATPVIRLPAKRMAGVLDAADWLRVTGLGVVLPIAVFLIVTRLTPFGGREYGAGHFQFMFPGVHLVALLLGLLIAPALVVRWRVAKRLAPLGLTDRFTVPLSFAALALILVWSLAALPVLTRFGMEKFVLIALAAPPAICLVLIFANALRSILSKPSTRLAQATTALAVLPAYAVAIVILCALTPIYSAGEKRWLAQETLLRINPDAPDLGAYEFKVAAQKRKEINAITGVE